MAADVSGFKRNSQLAAYTMSRMFLFPVIKLRNLFRRVRDMFCVALFSAWNSRLFRRCGARSGQERGFSALIFSMDRPLQLHSLLSSIRTYVSGLSTTTVLYRTSQPDFQKAYDRVAQSFPDVQFIQESNFRQDVLNLLDQMMTRWVFFLVDDILFVDELDFSTIPPDLLERAVISLRLHPNVTFSYMTQSAQIPPPLKPAGGGLLTFTWGIGSIDWSYPLSVDGHIFERTEIFKMLSFASFRAPNSLEASLQKYVPYVNRRRQGACWSTARLINFPLNRVQIEFPNLAGCLPTTKLLEAYNQGFILDFFAVKGKKFNTVHVDIDVPLVPR